MRTRLLVPVALALFLLAVPAWAEEDPTPAAVLTPHHIGLSLNVAPLGYYHESKDSSHQDLKHWVGFGAFYEADVVSHLRLGAEFSALFGPKHFIQDDDNYLHHRLVLLSADFNVRPHWQLGRFDPFVLVALGATYWNASVSYPLLHGKVTGGLAVALDAAKHAGVFVETGAETHGMAFYTHVFWLTNLGMAYQF